MLIIINGASGAGKTFLLKNLNYIKSPKFVPLKKYTTRSPRDFEKDSDPVDLIFNCDKNYISQLEYSYEYKNEYYGVSKKELQDIISCNEIPVLIIRSFKVIERIKMDFKDVCVFFIIGATSETLKNKLTTQQRASKDIALADLGFHLITEEYIKYISLVDFCIINSLYDKELYLNQFITFTREKLKSKDI